MALASHMDEYFGMSGLGATGVRKVSGNDNFLLESPI